MTRALLRSLLGVAGLAAALCAPVAQAQNYPARPVKIIVPFATGGPADNYARYIAQRPQPEAAAALIELMAGEGSRAIREAGGFEEA